MPRPASRRACLPQALWQLPTLSGIDSVARMRRQGSAVPVLMLTARDTPADRITGLDTRADDYLVKPFDFGELLARLRAKLAGAGVRIETVPRRRLPDRRGVTIRHAARVAAVDGYPISAVDSFPLRRISLCHVLISSQAYDGAVVQQGVTPIGTITAWPLNPPNPPNHHLHFSIYDLAQSEPDAYQYRTPVPFTGDMQIAGCNPFTPNGTVNWPARTYNGTAQFTGDPVSAHCSTGSTRPGGWWRARSGLRTSARRCGAFSSGTYPLPLTAMGLVAPATHSTTLPGVPTLLRPASNGTVSGNRLTFLWNNSGNAVGYRLQVSKASDFSSYVYNTSQLSTAQMMNLPGATTYYWRVRAINQAGMSAWSTVGMFRTQ